MRVIVKPEYPSKYMEAFVLSSPISITYKDGSKAHGAAKDYLLLRKCSDGTVGLDLYEKETFERLFLVLPEPEPTP